jgi:hypothetical protein
VGVYTDNSIFQHIHKAIHMRIRWLGRGRACADFKHPALKLWRQGGIEWRSLRRLTAFGPPFQMRRRSANTHKVDINCLRIVII